MKKIQKEKYPELQKSEETIMKTKIRKAFYETANFTMILLHMLVLVFFFFGKT